MSLEEIQVGSLNRLVVVPGDPNTASQYQSILSVADSRNLTGLYAGVVQGVPLLLNPSGNLDRQRAAKGTTGIAAVNTEGTRATYSVGTSAFTPVATATDFIAIIGSATTVVRVTRISLAGIANAATSIIVSLIKRSTANSGSTPADLTPGQHDSNDSAPTAVVRTYTTTNPTTGTGAGTVRAGRLFLPTSAGDSTPLVWDFTTRNSQGIVLRGVAQLLCLNWGGAAVPAGTALNFDVEFTEEAA